MKEEFQAGALIIGCVMGLILVIHGFMMSYNYLQYKTLQSVGAQVEFAYGSCLAKIDDRWIDCNVAVKNRSNFK